MLKNYFVVAWRNLQLNLFSAFINIIYLVVGLACFLLISLFLIDKLSYDTFLPMPNKLTVLAIFPLEKMGSKSRKPVQEVIEV